MPPARPLLVRRAWRELLEHFVHAFIQVLDVLVRVAREGIARAAPPYQLLGLGVEEIHYHRANLVRLSRGGRFTETTAAKASPTPPASQPVIKSIQGLLRVGHLYGHDAHVAPGFHLRPAFSRQRGIDRALHAIDIQGILGLYVFPRVRLVLREICAAVVI